MRCTANHRSDRNELTVAPNDGAHHAAHRFQVRTQAGIPSRGCGAALSVMAERGLSISSAQPQPDFRIPASAGMTENRRGTAHVSGHSEPWLRECVGCDGGSWWCEPRSERRGRRRTATSTFAGSVRSRHLLGACGGPRDRLGAASASLLDAVEAVLHQRHRASSAIEGFNCGAASVSPCPQRRHPRVSRPVRCLVQPAHAALGTAQGACPRACPRMPVSGMPLSGGTSAHQCLTAERVHDWLTLLGYPPSPALS